MRRRGKACETGCQMVDQHILVSFEGPEETRGARFCIPEIFYIFSFGGQVP